MRHHGCEHVIERLSDLVNGTIVDSLTGNLLDGGNTAIVNSNCSATLPVGDTCTITTARVIQAGDPNPWSTP